MLKVALPFSHGEEEKNKTDQMTEREVEEDFGLYDDVALPPISSQASTRPVPAFLLGEEVKHEKPAPAPAATTTTTTTTEPPLPVAPVTKEEPVYEQLTPGDQQQVQLTPPEETAPEEELKREAQEGGEESALGETSRVSPEVSMMSVFVGNLAWVEFPFRLLRALLFTDAPSFSPSGRPRKNSRTPLAHSGSCVA